MSSPTTFLLPLNSATITVAQSGARLLDHPALQLEPARRTRFGKPYLDPPSLLSDSWQSPFRLYSEAAAIENKPTETQFTIISTGSSRLFRSRLQSDPRHHISRQAPLFPHDCSTEPTPSCIDRTDTSPTKAGSDALPNRIHRRVVLSDYGIPIYEASSREALLAVLADCIEGHESLRQKAGLLQRDISIGNLMISKDSGGFLIDLDLAVREQLVGASRAKGKTGTRAFMAIGALLGEQHSFMHDLESFFWVLFRICIHCDGPGEGKVVAQFDRWNFADTEELARLKKGRYLMKGTLLRQRKRTLHPITNQCSAQSDREERRARREQEAIDKLRREEEERAERERLEIERLESEIAEMKSKIKEKEAQLQEKRKQNEK
ncbi:hypothetical protein V8F33_009029 [Rhypophila sp. PSN 637]